jgi:hypothetical protein
MYFFGNAKQSVRLPAFDAGLLGEKDEHTELAKKTNYLISYSYNYNGFVTYRNTTLRILYDT